MPVWRIILSLPSVWRISPKKSYLPIHENPEGDRSGAGLMKGKGSNERDFPHLKSWYYPALHDFQPLEGGKMAKKEWKKNLPLPSLYSKG